MHSEADHSSHIAVIIVLSILCFILLIVIIIKTPCCRNGRSINTTTLLSFLRQRVASDVRRLRHAFSPRSLKRFYLEAFLIPAYRQEWGKYSKWKVFYNKEKTEKPPSSESVTSIKPSQVVPVNSSVTTRRSQSHPTVFHDHRDCERVVFNVSGFRFETQLKTLKRYPMSLLGNPRLLNRFYDPEKQEYFLDRSRISFPWIIFYYQNGGRLHYPATIPPEIFYEELMFFKLGKSVINRFLKDIGMLDGKRDLLPTGMYSRKIWVLFEYPRSSKPAQHVAILSIIVVTVSIMEFCMETLREFPVNEEQTINLREPFFFVDTVCSSWFTFELVVRFMSCPNTAAFVFGILNIIDLVSVLPYYVNIILTTAGAKNSTSLVFLRVIRLLRIFRIFKLSRHSKGLKILGRTLRASRRDLSVLVFFLLMIVILFSTAMWIAESTVNKTVFTSIPDGFWWAVETMTTVGYGDMVPVTVYGKIIGSLCAVAGVLTVTLPVSVIVSNFSHFYKLEGDSKTFQSVSSGIKHVQMCPNYPAGFEPSESDTRNTTSIASVENPNATPTLHDRNSLHQIVVTGSRTSVAVGVTGSRASVAEVPVTGSRAPVAEVPVTESHTVLHP